MEESKRTVQLYMSLASIYYLGSLLSVIGDATRPISSVDIPLSMKTRMKWDAVEKLRNELNEEGITGPNALTNDPTFTSGFARNLCHKAMRMADSYRDQEQYHLQRQLMIIVLRHVLVPALLASKESDTGFDIAAVYCKLKKWEQHLVLDCLRNTPESLISEGMINVDIILAWHEAIDVMCRSIEFQVESEGLVARGHDWERSEVNDDRVISSIISTLNRSGRAFNLLANTGLAHHRTSLVDWYLHAFDGTAVHGIDKTVLIEQNREAMTSLLRHPDPERNPKLGLFSPHLQVSGSWRKIPIDPSKSVGKRHSCSAFIHKGYLYVAGGLIYVPRRHSSFDPRDVWRLDLENPIVWEFVSKYPISEKEYPLFLSQEMRVHGDRAYLFTGRPQLDFLDLKTGIWRCVNTTYQFTTRDDRAGVDPTWPWPGNICEGASQQIIGDRLFVFGGTNGITHSGSNLFMELDLKTLCWRRLSGHTYPLEFNYQLNLPGPRHSAASWVGDNGKKFYLLYGTRDKKRPELGLGNAYGPPVPWMWDDMWSWDIQSETWHRERVSGNPPSPRFAMSCVYNPNIDKVVVFGGVNYMCPYRAQNSSHAMDFLMYGDSFIWNPPRAGASAESTLEAHWVLGGDNNTSKPGEMRPVIRESRWQQVTTYGFPTYRCRAQLVCDPDTGKVYLYGGYARAETVPSRNRTEELALRDAKYDPTFSKSHAYFFGSDAVNGVKERHSYYVFGDVWQLHIDIPGGDFEVINQEGEIRTAQPGPWQRCFMCEKVGFWKKCGGTCNGQAHFCSRDCQVKGRVDHKRLHKCTKNSSRRGV